MAKLLIAMSALLAMAAADVSHLFGQQYHHHVHQVPAQQQVFQYSQPIPYQQRPIAILRSVNDNSGFGDYQFGYDTENGIQVNEQASQKSIGPNEIAKTAQGSYSYTGPDGVVYTVNWIADENGYRASGAHLPVPPPIPAEIERSLALNAAPQSRFFK